MRNIENKARCHDHAFIRQRLSELNAEFRGIDRQADTYYKVRNGRLKLRQGNIENALIYYQRENAAGPKNSQLLLYKTGDSAVLRAILGKTLEELVVVEKEREIYFIGKVNPHARVSTATSEQPKNENNGSRTYNQVIFRVKVHLDKVKELGTFAEIEVLDREENLDIVEMEKACRDYMDIFQIRKEDLVDCSYSDMLLDR